MTPSGSEMERATDLALALLDGIDAKLRLDLNGISKDQRFQWAILKAVVGDTESVYRLLRGWSFSDDPRFPVGAVKVVLNLVD